MKSKKSIFKRLTALVCAGAVAVSIAVSTAVTAFAENTKTQVLLNWGYDFRGSGLPNAYDPITGGNTDNQFNWKWANDFSYWTDSSGKTAYCVQFGTTATDKDLTKDEDLTHYYSSARAKLLQYATVYYYKGSTHYGYSKEEELVASQCLVWAISAGYFDSSSTALSTNERTLLNCIKAPSTTAKNNMMSCYKKMKEDILSHTTIFSKGYSTASSATANKYPLTYDINSGRWKATIKSDSYLAAFTHESISGVTFTRSGNDLEITATNDGMKKLVSHGAVKFTKNKAKNASKMDSVLPMFLKAKSSSANTQAQITYFSGSNAVNAYIAFEADRGGLSFTKTYKTSSGSSATATSANNSALNAGAKFKLYRSASYKDSREWYRVNAAKSSAGNYTFSSCTKSNDGTVLTLGSNGKLTVTGLPPAKYYLVEYATASGYKLNDSYITTSGSEAPCEIWGVVVNADGTASFSGENTSATGELKITKKLSVNGKVSSITSADNWTKLKSSLRFVVKNSKGEYLDLSGSNGVYTYVGTRSAAREIALDANGNIDIKNLPYGTYKISEKTVSGVTFEELGLKEAGAAVSVTVSSSTAGKSIINYGESEKELHISKEIIPYDDDAGVTDEMWEGINFYVVFQTASGSSYVTVKQTDAENGIYEFVDVNGKSGDENTLIHLGTDSHTATLVNIPSDVFTSIQMATVFEGSYSGYTVDHFRNSVFFDDKQSGSVNFVNTETSGKLQVHKTTEGMNDLGGIEFRLTGTSYSGRQVDISAVTDDSGLAVFEKVPTGHYTVSENRETVNTDVYLTAKNTSVWIDRDETEDITVRNEKKTGDLKIVKRTSGMTALSGIEFTVSGTSDSGREISMSAVTNAKGIADFGSLPIGTYTVVENASTVPAGYITADDQTVEVVYAETAVAEFFNDTTKVLISKKEKSTENHLSGALLQILDMEGKVLAEWESIGKPYKLIGILEAGHSYILHEASAPEGYEVAADVEFTVPESGEQFDLTLEDAKTPEIPVIPDKPETPVKDVPPATGAAKAGIPAAIVLGGIAVLLEKKNKNKKKEKGDE